MYHAILLGMRPFVSFKHFLNPYQGVYKHENETFPLNYHWLNASDLAQYRNICFERFGRLAKVLVVKSRMLRAMGTMALSQARNGLRGNSGLRWNSMEMVTKFSRRTMMP